MTAFDRRAYEIRDIDQATALDLVEAYHYARGGSNTAVYRHGLFRVGADAPLGVAWWLPPTKFAAIATYPEGDWRRVLSLSRLVVDPSVPTNGASFLIGASIRQIRKDGRFDCLVTYADEWRNHTGAIYRATNWEYCGLTKPQPCWVSEDGRLTATKAGPRTRTRAEMEALGHRFLGRFAKHKYRMVLR